MRGLRLAILIFTGIFLVLPLSSSQLIIGSDNPSLPKIDITPPSVTNYTQQNVNSSDFWDLLDVPTDISGSEFWYNETEAVTLQQAFDNEAGTRTVYSDDGDMLWDFLIDDFIIRLDTAGDNYARFQVKDGDDNVIMQIAERDPFGKNAQVVLSRQWAPMEDNLYDLGIEPTPPMYPDGIRWKNLYLAGDILGSIGSYPALNISGSTGDIIVGHGGFNVTLNGTDIWSAGNLTVDNSGFFDKLNISSEIYVNELAVSSWLYNMTILGIYEYNETLLDFFRYNTTTASQYYYNMTGAKPWDYNQTDTQYNYNMTGIGEFDYNMSSWNISGSYIFPKDLGLSVGIGTTTPEEVLDVEGDIRFGSDGQQTIATVVNSWGGNAASQQLFSINNSGTGDYSNLRIEGEIKMGTWGVSATAYPIIKFYITVGNADDEISWGWYSMGGNSLAYPELIKTDTQRWVLNIKPNGWYQRAYTKYTYDTLAIPIDTSVNGDAGAIGTTVAPTKAMYFPMNVTVNNNLIVDGKVGIGTDSPNTVLELAGSTNEMMRTTVAGDSSAFYIIDTNNVQKVKWGYRATDDAFKIIHAEGGADFTGAAGLIVKAGNVGIGTASPVGDLHILDATVPTMRLDHDADPALGDNIGIIYFEANGYTAARIRAVSAYQWPTSRRASLHFDVMQGSSPVNDAMVLTNLGRLGIGTDLPTHELNVVGDTNISNDLFIGDDLVVYGSVGSLTFKGGADIALSSGGDIDVPDGYICVEDTTGGDCAGTTDGFIYADDFVEHSIPIPEKGLDSILQMKNKEDGTLDHSSFGDCQAKDSEGKLAEGVSLSCQVKSLIKSVQELFTWNDEQDLRIDELKEENNLLKSELCKKDNTYSWCKGVELQ